MCDMTHPHVRHDSFICDVMPFTSVTRRIHTQPNLFTRHTPHSHTHNMTHPYTTVRPHIIEEFDFRLTLVGVDTPRFFFSDSLMCDMTHSYIRGTTHPYTTWRPQLIEQIDVCLTFVRVDPPRLFLLDAAIASCLDLCSSISTPKVMSRIGMSHVTRRIESCLM